MKIVVRCLHGYVFSAMGFYPVDPISGKYEIGTPMYPEMKMHLANGKNIYDIGTGCQQREYLYPVGKTRRKTL